MMCGCPKELFLALGEVIFKGKMYLSGEISTVEFRTSLAKSERLRDWQAKRDIFPTNDPHWRLLANAFRHALILQVLRFPDTFGRHADSLEVQRSVVGILDAAAGLPGSTPLAKSCYCFFSWRERIRCLFINGIIRSFGYKRFRAKPIFESLR